MIDHRYVLYALGLLLLLLTACEDAPPVVELPITQDPVTTTVAPEPAPPVPQPPAGEGIGGMSNMDPRDLPIMMVDVNQLLTPAQLAAQVSQAVNPIYPNWILLANGSYIVFDDPSEMPNLVEESLTLLEQHRPKTVEDGYWMYSISNLVNIEGWSVYGNGYGIYTYVHPSELKEANPAMTTVAAFAKAKRALDEATPQVIYVHTSSGLAAYTK